MDRRREAQGREMNCLEFHREKLADPHRLSPEARSHAQTCASCGAFARSVDEAERGLEQALATPVPEGLADRIILRSRTRNRTWRAWALAAGIVLAVAAGFAGLRPGEDRYARLAIEHVVMEPESFTTMRNAGPEAFRAALQAFGGSLKQPLENVRYVMLCPVEGGFGWHVVFETPEGLATLILVPDKPLHVVQQASTRGWNALARPAKNGYYAIVTSSSAATARAERLLRERVDWDA
jgi:hypothetical protein